MATVAVFVFFVFTHLLLLYSAESCPTYFCNEKVGNIFFPFKNETQPSPECGYYNVDCSDSEKPKIQLKEKGYWFELESMPRSGSINIKDESLQDRLEHLQRSRDNCSDEVFSDLSLPKSPLLLNISTNNLTLFRCNNTPHRTPYKDPNYACRNSRHTYYTVSNSSLNCSAIQTPLIPGYHSNVYNHSALTARFSLLVQFTQECDDCYKRIGRCLDDNGKFKCDRPCWNETREFNCSLAKESKCRVEKEARKCGKTGTHLGMKLGLGLGGPAFLGVRATCLFLFRRYKKKARFFRYTLQEHFFSAILKIRSRRGHLLWCFTLYL